MKPEALLSALIQLSKVDNHFDQFEFAYILKVGRHIGIEDETVESMIKNADSIGLEIPSDEKERMSVIYYMLFLMKVDHKITAQEKELVHHYGFKLGFSSQMMNEFIELIEKNKDSKVAVQDMLDIVRKYQN